MKKKKLFHYLFFVTIYIPRKIIEHEFKKNIEKQHVLTKKF